MQGGSIIALDLATVTGFAIGRVGERPRFGTWRLKSADDEQDRATRNLGCRLRDEFMLQRPDLVVVESPMPSGAMLGAGNASHTVDFAWMLCGAVGAICGPYSVRMVRANVQRVRKSFTGQGRPPDPKKFIAAHCRMLGFEVTDHNAADAIALWHFQSGYIFGELALARAP